MDHNFVKYRLCTSKRRRYSKYQISGNNVNVDDIEMSSFCSECALFEYVIKREYILTDKRLILHVMSHNIHPICK